MTSTKRPKNKSKTLQEIREILCLERLIPTICEKLAPEDQHRFAVDCALRSLPLFEDQFPGYPQPREALRLRQLLADHQLSEHAWLAAAHEVHSLLDALGLKAPVDDWEPNAACRAAHATIADSDRAAFYSSAALLVGTEDIFPYATEIHWQWNRVNELLSGEVREKKAQQEHTALQTPRGKLGGDRT